MSWVIESILLCQGSPVLVAELVMKSQLHQSEHRTAFLLPVQAGMDATDVEASQFVHGVAHPATAQPCLAKDAETSRGRCREAGILEMATCTSSFSITGLEVL